MAESNQQQQVSEGTGSNVQWAADHVTRAPGVVTQVRSETTTYATDGDRFVERHEVLAGPLGEEEGYVEKREGHLGVPSGGVVEEVEEGREIGLLEPEGKVDADEVEEEDDEDKADEVEGGEKEIGALDEDDEKDVSASDDVESGGEGTKEPPHSLAETPEKKAETGPAATVAAEAVGEAPVRAAREQDAASTSTAVPVAAAPEDDVALVDSERKRKAGEQEGG
ncbi:hypothetical protein V502_03317, partial [Pseudogymnoascus sp. VKM F-4520 (FW-2644)]